MLQLVREILALIAFLTAIIFGIGGVVGLFRFPDPYSRLQAGSLCGTTAVFSIFIGALLLAPNGAIAVRVAIITLFFLISSPTGSHLVARFVWNSGIYPWKPEQSKRSSQPRGSRSRSETHTESSARSSSPTTSPNRYSKELNTMAPPLAPEASQQRGSLDTNSSDSDSVFDSVSESKDLIPRLGPKITVNAVTAKEEDGP